MIYRQPTRIFEDSGIVNPDTAFHVRIDNVVNTRNQDMRTMVDHGRYFSIFAPRQSGKTTFFNEFGKQLEIDPTYITILLSFQNFKNLAALKFYKRIQNDIADQLLQRLEFINCPQRDEVVQYCASLNLTDHIAFYELFETLNRLIRLKKIVIFIDEFDGIPAGELENFLATIREMYQKYKMRKEKALYSVGLVGIRNIPKLIVGGVSPFNIADQVCLPPFSLKNISDLYAQYTDETNQPFTEEAVKKIYEETAGQPWLVNRLGTILTIDIKPETTDPIMEEDVEKAVKHLLMEKNNHFDNLFIKAQLFKEVFVEIVFNGVEYHPYDESQSWLEQYGLIREKDNKAVVFNPIYQEQFLKTFFREIEKRVDVAAQRYYFADGSLNMQKILTDFEKYIIRIGASAFYSTKNPMEVTGKFQLTAWLYQFVSGGNGYLHYESRTGLGIMDIILVFNKTKYIIETKINRYKGTIDDALEQLTEKYLQTQNVDHGYIVMFDPKIQVGELCTPQTHTVKGKKVLSFNIGIGKVD